MLKILTITVCNLFEQLVYLVNYIKPHLSTKEFSPEEPKCLKRVVVVQGSVPVSEKTTREIALCPSGGEVTILSVVSSVSWLVTARPSAWSIYF